MSSESSPMPKHRRISGGYIGGGECGNYNQLMGCIEQYQRNREPMGLDEAACQLIKTKQDLYREQVNRQQVKSNR
jgi:hypothetical protein